MKISIIVPVYNVKEYFNECMESLVSQTYKDIEILLVDDGSSDGTECLCDEWANQDERIQVFHKVNEGTHSARNLGLEKATGIYVMFIDPDDWLELNTIEFCAKKIQENDLDVIRYNYIREYNGQPLKKENSFLEEKIYAGENCKKILRQTLGLVEDELIHPENLNFLASVCFSIYRKSIIDSFKIQFYNIREIGTFSDGLFNINYLLHAKNFQFINQYFYHYRKTNPKSATANYRENFLEKQLILFEEIKRLLEENALGEEIKRAYLNRIALSSMELCLNVYKRKSSFRKKYGEIKKILKNGFYVEAFKTFKLKYLPLKWRIYYGLIKRRFVLGVCFMTKLMKLIKRHGK